MQYEDMLAEEMADLDREQPGWDRESRVATARHFLKETNIPKDVLTVIYGEDIMKEIENDVQV